MKHDMKLYKTSKTTIKNPPKPQSMKQDKHKKDQTYFS